MPTISREAAIEALQKDFEFLAERSRLQFPQVDEAVAAMDFEAAHMACEANHKALIEDVGQWAFFKTGFAHELSEQIPAARDVGNWVSYPRADGPGFGAFATEKLIDISGTEPHLLDWQKHAIPKPDSPLQMTASSDIHEINGFDWHPEPMICIAEIQGLDEANRSSYYAFSAESDEPSSMCVMVEKPLVEYFTSKFPNAELFLSNRGDSVKVMSDGVPVGRIQVAPVQVPEQAIDGILEAKLNTFNELTGIDQQLSAGLGDGPSAASNNPQEPPDRPSPAGGGDGGNTPPDGPPSPSDPAPDALPHQDPEQELLAQIKGAPNDEARIQILQRLASQAGLTMGSGPVTEAGREFDNMIGHFKQDRDVDATAYLAGHLYRKYIADPIKKLVSKVEVPSLAEHRKKSLLATLDALEQAIPGKPKLLGAPAGADKPNEPQPLLLAHQASTVAQRLDPTSLLDGKGGTDDKWFDQVKAKLKAITERAEGSGMDGGLVEKIKAALAGIGETMQALWDQAKQLLQAPQKSAPERVEPSWEP